MIVALALTIAIASEKPDFASLPREERVRLLKARTWEMRALRVQEKLSIDGRLDEEAWRRAEPITDFFQRETFEGLPATEPTHV